MDKHKKTHPHPMPHGAKKLTPGHYAAIPRSDNQLAMMARALVPGLKGFLIRCQVRELEPVKGNYEFAWVAEVLAWCAANSVQLVVMIVDKTFDHRERPLPIYMQALEIPNRNGGYTANRWHATYVSRMRALIRAFGVRFDKHANFEGVSLQESSLGLSDTVLDQHGYTPELYRDALIDIITHANQAMPNTRMHWHMNYIPQKQIYVQNVAQAMVSGGHLLGGPDLLPDAYLLKRACYPFYGQFKDKLTTFIDAQYDSYRHVHRTASRTKYWTPAELHAWAKANLFTDYQFWTYVPKPSPSDSYCYTDAVPVIARDA